MAGRKQAVPEPLVRAVNEAAKLSFVLCHAEGHQWRHHSGIVDPIDAEPGMRPPGHEQTARGTRSTCTSCSMQRLRWYTRDGYATNKYKAADGYYHKRAKGDDDPAPTHLEWRRTLVATLFDEQPKRRLRSAAS